MSSTEAPVENSKLAESTAVAQDKVAEVAHQKEQEATETKEAAVKSAQDQAAHAAAEPEKKVEQKVEAAKTDAAAQAEAVKDKTTAAKPEATKSEEQPSTFKKFMAKIKKLLK
ncbi:uncharacterized protein LALA0_S13e01178g [Lachancea lanzarotensis]|uniref:LALA0S13e01178g1_1 n=1 Tax=Lachancea lanzarotensis TaxID=1245769 RepID=A0A0C7NG90_9SACH|nr:uncharacterized protein LALA0_S13e01178g [Lachancea lanzarotensis]CEP64707.1 LALA0S13e01178g1_1 [Lachancea lanzarotensis]